MALVFQPISHNIESDRSEENGEQNQNAHRLVESRLLINVHKIITVLSYCTIFFAVL